jgi:phosphoribulokinase
VRGTFEEIFRREGVTCAIVEGDAFHRYDREQMKEKMAEMQRQGYAQFSHFGPEANLFDEFESLFRQYREPEAASANIYMTRRRRLPMGWKRARSPRRKVCTAKTDKIDVAQYADLLVGICAVD